MPEYEIGDRVQITRNWPLGAKGKIVRFAPSGQLKMARVQFDRPHRVEGYDYTYSWYTDDQMRKLVPGQQIEENNQPCSNQ